ncbi:hypothetical protein FA15DRAFT_665984 [Coprinopsis marcescibilis]|uniref:Uncharacterized protein n=1 Tax=Coprinopsis marcescibilis TaxID=230819 RepID=A0A5C3LGW3_COPMA|nr:hypothetical protein FA15DRAFT_665984 [Coprinopsis marcescibilis]
MHVVNVSNTAAGSNPDLSATRNKPLAPGKRVATTRIPKNAPNSGSGSDSTSASFRRAGFKARQIRQGPAYQRSSFLVPVAPKNDDSKAESDDSSWESDASEEEILAAGISDALGAESSAPSTALRRRKARAITPRNLFESTGPPASQSNSIAPAANTQQLVVATAAPSASADRRPLTRTRAFKFITITVILFLAITPFIVSRRLSRDLLCQLAPINRLEGCKQILFQEETTDPDQPGPVKQADHGALSELQVTTFSQLSKDNMGSFGRTTASNLKRSEVAIWDLIELVKMSELEQKDILAQYLAEFAEDASYTGEALSALSAKFNGALDDITAMSEWSFNRVASAVKREQELKTLGGWVNSLMPWSSNEKTADEVTREAFKISMELYSEQLGELIVGVKDSRSNLQRLESKMNVTGKIVMNENEVWDKKLKDLDNFFSNLWMHVAGDGKKRNFEKQLAVLRDVTKYRKEAMSHIDRVQYHLQTMNHDMKEIRKRTTRAVVSGARIPLEVQLRSIMHGLEGLKASRLEVRRAEQQARKKFMG